MSFFYLLIVTLAFLRMWGAIDIPGFLILVFIFLSSYKDIRRPSTYRNVICLMALFCVVNAFTSNYFRGQDVISTLRQTSPYMMICSYFFFIDRRISVPKLEKLVYVLTILFDCLYLLQYILYPYGIVIFPDAETEYSSDVRLRLYGQNICSLGMLFAFNKYLVTNRKKFLCLAVFSFFIVFLWGFRTLFAASSLAMLIMYCKIRGGAKPTCHYTNTDYVISVGISNTNSTRQGNGDAGTSSYKPIIWRQRLYPKPVYYLLPHRTFPVKLGNVLGKRHTLRGNRLFKFDGISWQERLPLE